MLKPCQEYPTQESLENSNLQILESNASSVDKYEEWCQIQTDLEGIKDIMATCHAIVDVRQGFEY